MSDASKIKVHVVDYGRKNYLLRYDDPVSGKRVSRTSEVSVGGPRKRREAEKEAAQWEAELHSGKYKPASSITWSEFRDRFEEEKLTKHSDSYAAVMTSTFNHFENLDIAMLRDISAESISRFEAILWKAETRESTIRCYLKHLKAALNWAVKIQLIPSAPQIEISKRARTVSKSMKGRPITTEEFERMLAAVDQVCPFAPEPWRRYLKGLWFSGLRLAESLRLSWDDDSDITIDLSGQHPRFRIWGEGQKSGRDQFLPMTPDFAEFILSTPEAEREGLVFVLPGRKGNPLKRDAVVRLVSKIGRTAGVVIDKKEDQYATAHDLRRSFGTRWSSKVKPAVLQKLMRHADIKTTMEFYVAQEADDISADLWREHKSAQTGNRSGNSESDVAQEKSHNSK